MIRVRWTCGGYCSVPYWQGHMDDWVYEADECNAEIITEESEGDWSENNCSIICPKCEIQLTQKFDCPEIIMKQEHIEFLEKESEKCHVSFDLLRDGLVYDAEKRGVSLEEMIEEEIAASSRLENIQLTADELKQLVETLNPDPRHFEGD